MNRKVQYGADGTVNVGPKWKWRQREREREGKKEKHAFVLTFSVITLLAE